MITHLFRRTFGAPVLLFALALTLTACGSKTAEKKDEAPAAVTEKRYECPMHPEVNQAEPGTCPKCKMDLLEVVAPTKESGAHDHGDGDHDHAGAGHDHGDGASPAAHTDHNPKHGGLFGMQGDHHLELVARHGGALSVYAYDAYTKPLDMTKASGTVTLELPDGAPTRVVPLAFDASSGALAGASPEADRALSATIDIQVSGTALSMTFPLQSTLTGEVVDISCLARLGPEKGRGLIHAECARACILKGMPVGLAVGNTVYVLTLEGSGSERAANERLADLAGRQVAVTGRITEVNGLKVLELSDVKEEM